MANAYLGYCLIQIYITYSYNAIYNLALKQANIVKKYYSEFSSSDTPRLSLAN